MKGCKKKRTFVLNIPLTYLKAMKYRDLALLLFLAFGVIGYHSYSILKDQLNIYHSSILAIILIILFV